MNAKHNSLINNRRGGRPSHWAKVPEAIRKVAWHMIRFGGYSAVEIYGSLDLLRFGLKFSTFQHMLSRYRKRRDLGNYVDTRADNVADLIADWIRTFPRHQAREILLRVADRCHFARDPISRRLDNGGAR